MSTTNTGSQTLVWDYKHPTEGKEFNQLLRNAVKPGIYKGGVLSVVDSSTASISPFITFLNVTGVNGDNKVIKLETSETVSIAVNSSTPIIYIKYDWLDTEDNYADFETRSIASSPTTNEVKFGLALFNGSTLIGFDISSTYRDYGTFDKDYNLYTKNFIITSENFHPYSRHQINSSISDDSQNNNATYEVKRLDDETQTNRSVSIFTAYDTITLSGSNHGLIAGDYIQIESAITPLNNGEYKIDSVNGAILTVNTTYKKVNTSESGSTATCSKLVNAKLTWNENKKRWLAGYDGDGLTINESKLATEKEIKANTIYDQTIDSNVEVNNCVYFHTSRDTVDNCDTSNWTDDSEMTSSLNTTTYLLDSALNLTKDGGTSTTASSYKTTSFTLDFTDKELILHLYIDDSTTLATLTSTSCIIIRYGSDSSNYYQWEKDSNDLTTGWNTIKSLTSSSADSTEGSPTITAMDYIYIALITSSTTDTWTSGKVIMDQLYLKNSQSWKKASGLTPTPQGIYIGNSGVVLDGYTDQLKPLIPGFVYYMKSNGDLTPKITESYNNTKVLYALNHNEAVIDIDVEESDLSIITYGKGYCIGGSAGAKSSAIEDLIFSNETSQAISATLDTSKDYGAGVNSSSKGYIMGGDTGSATDVIEDLIFINETSQAITATLDTTEYYLPGVNSGNKGYCIGGYTGGGYSNAIEDLIFSNETSQAISATLDASKYGGAGVNSSSKGYYMGGTTGAEKDVIEDLIFSSETSQAITATLDTPKRWGTGINSFSKGYIMGGYSSSTHLDVIEDLIFSNETSQAITATLDTAKYGSAGVNNSSKGYIMGGTTGAYTAVIEDLIFSSEVSQAITATLDAAKQGGTGVNTTKG